MELNSMIMNPEVAAWWDRWHQRKELPPGPSPLALHSLKWFKERNAHSILELGFGRLYDAIWFVQQGFTVYGLDFSRAAFKMAKERIRKEKLTGITVQRYDYLNPLPFADGRFDVVYSHYSLHYFDNETTASVFAEVNRVLQKDGLFTFSVKSIHDSQCGVGNPVGLDMFDDEGDAGHIRHFFSRECLLDLLAEFEVLSLQESTMHYAGCVTCGFEVIATVPACVVG